MKILSILLIVLSFIGLSVAETVSEKKAVLIGEVFDAETFEPLAYTNVYFDSTSRGASTKRNGHFLIDNITPGTYTIVVDRIGYSAYKETGFKILAGDTIKKSFHLSPSLIESEAVIVTASLREQTAQMAPAKVDIISAKDLRRRSIVTFDQALDNVPGVSVYRSAGTSVQSLSIRGSSDVAGGGVGNRVLLLVDGRPALSSDTGGALWSLIPTNIIERVEVLKGAFSSLYGSTAMGGVVNVITRRPAYKRMGTVDVGYGVYQPASADIKYTDEPLFFKQLQMSYSGITGDLSYLFNTSYKTSDGHSQNSQYAFYNVFSKLIYDLQDSRYLELSLSRSEAENDYPHTWKNNLYPLQVAEKYKDDLQKKKDFSVDFKYWAIPSEHLNYSSRFYMYRNESRSFFNSSDPDILIPGNQPFGWGTSVDADKFGHLTQFDFTLADNQKMIAGIDLQIDQVKSSPDTVMYGNRQVNNFAVYMQDEWKINPDLITTIGLRYDFNKLIGGVTQTQLSSNIALVYQVDPSTTIRVLLGQGFRAPSIAERFFQKELNGGTLFKPNPNLKAERTDLSFESGVTWNVLDNLSFNAAYFRNHYKDMIFWQEISEEEGVVYTLFQVRNLNSALVQGLEFSVSYNPFKNLRTNINYTYLDAQDESPGRINDTLPYRVKHALKGSVDWLLGDISLHFDSRYKSKVEEVFLYPLEAPQAYILSNAKLNYAFNKTINFSLAVNNLFNTQYEELARYRMPGRNFLVETHLQF